MGRALRRTSELNVWPAFTDAMLAFVLVLVLMLAYQVGRAIQIIGPTQNAIISDQRAVEDLLDGLNLGGVRYDRGVGRTDITLGSEVLFPSGSADLNPQGSALLNALASAVAGRGLPTLQEIQVQGHTDNVPTDGRRFSTNWELSTARASEVVRFLSESGVDPVRVHLSATGYGEFTPVASNESAEGRAMNRRIELRLLYAQREQ